MLSRHRKNQTFAIQATHRSIFQIPNWEGAKKRLQDLERPVWNGEVYTKKNKSGKYPFCRTCKEKINIGTLCLRVDISEIRKENNKYDIHVSPQRYCANLKCTNNQMAKEKDNQNFEYPQIIQTRHINEENKIILKHIFANTDIAIGST